MSRRGRGLARARLAGGMALGLAGAWIVGAPMMAAGQAVPGGATGVLQEPGVPAAGQVASRAEAPVAGLVRRDADTVALTLPAANGRARAIELLVHGFHFNGDVVATNKLHLRQVAPGVVEITSVAYSLGDWDFSVTDTASYYGLGEHFDTLDHAHTIVKNASQDNNSVKGSGTYKPMPFFMSTTGYGMWVDTTAEATFDMNATKLTEIAVGVPAERLRIVLFTEPEFPKILEQFTGLTQRAILPPYWAFAPWMGRDYHQDQAQVMEDVEKTRALGLPASVILIDSPWTTSYNSYKFNAKQFADAPGMVKALHGDGYKLVLWHTPWTNSKSDTPREAGFAGKMAEHAENYDEAAEHGYFVKRPDGKPYVARWWKGEGSLIDFTNPQAKAWWQEQVRGAIRSGADGFKDDDGEGSFQGEVKFADGSNPELMRNRYAVLYNNAMEELIAKDLKGNGVLFARSVTEGANGIGFLWGGDQDSNFSVENGLPSAVTAGLSAGMSGMPLWTADLGGYMKGGPAPDVAVNLRGTEFAAFSPTMEILSQWNLQPWRWDEAAAGVSGGTKALDTYRKYAVLHMSLFPYRYAAAQVAAKTGMPILRALPLLYQNDVKARQARHEYMFGPDFLVAPVVDENTRRPVYLPAGSWVDYWTGAPVTGGRTVVVDAPLEVVPVYVRAGAVIAKIPEDVMTLVPAAESGNAAVKTLDERRVYEVIPGGEGETTVTDFEGRVLKRTGRSLTIGMASSSAATGSAEGKVEGERPVGDKVAGTKPAHVVVRLRYERARGVTVNGAPAQVQQVGDASVVEFDLTKESVVAWQ